jgi:putative intracellular protease/amidase
MTDTKNIGIVLFPDVEELDAIGPWEVLAVWDFRVFPRHDEAWTPRGGRTHESKQLAADSVVICSGGGWASLGGQRSEA